mmetsp:Transcript_20752/g.29297  ORF Transcript_20752/g.29297 Transcript_20752/m.29297 type:complete len:116 (-) Transcript_20752:1412-1759(-)
MASKEEIYAAMTQALEGSSGENLKKKFNASVVFVVDGVAWALDAKNLTLKKEKMKGADLTVIATLQVMQDLLTKKLTPQQAFLRRKIRVKGNMGLAMKLTFVVAATRKCLPRSKL